MPNDGVFAVEQFGILRWKAHAKTNLLMVLKLKYDAHSPSNREICLNNLNRKEKPCVCSVQYVHGNHHTLLLTSRSLACKDRKLVFTLKLLKSHRMLWGRVEWFSLFLIFENGHIVIDWLYFYEFNSKKLVNFAKCTRHALPANFLFSKNHRDLENEYFFKNLQEPSFYIKEQL